jgi:radical SAM superfamily enzyme YgiQ (UPF0313 family)
LLQALLASIGFGVHGLPTRSTLPRKNAAATLRRLAHYDYWSDTVRKSILLDCKADLVVFGMGEEAILEIARELQSGKTTKDLRGLRGIAYAMGASESGVGFQPALEESSPTAGWKPTPLGD